MTTLQARRGFIGLVTATSETNAPEGALRIADNVTLRRRGALASREGFSSMVTMQRPYLSAFAYKGVYFYRASDHYIYRPTQVKADTSGMQALLRADIVTAAEARNNLYLPGAAGIFKLTSTAGTSAPRAGLPTGVATISSIALLTTGSPLLLAANQRVAYRIVATYTDANGVIIRGRPTGAALVTSGASPSTPQVNITVNPNVTTSSRSQPTNAVEIYRTRVFPSSATPDEEFQLVGRIKADPAAPSSYTFVDRLPDSARSMTLYTSPSRGGVENASDPPPAAACIARFRGSLFFGNITGPQRFVISWKAQGDITGSATGFGSRAVTGNTTAGSPTITNLSSTTGIRAGTIVAMPGQWRQRVVSVSGNTATMELGAQLTVTGTAVTFHDALSLNGIVYEVGTLPNGGIGSYPSRNITGSNPIWAAYEVTPPEPGYDYTLVVERHLPSDPVFTIASSRGDETWPPVALHSDATHTQSTADVLPHGLCWSEPDEPEHVPLKNYARVGDASKAILALAATRDSLFILKEDGVFRLSGTTSANFRIDPFDTTAVCVLPGSVRVVRNTVLALCTIGLVAITEGGVRIVSSPIQNEIASVIQAIRTNQKTSGLYLMPGLSGTAATADEANGEYMLGLGSRTTSFGGEALVYSLEQDGFTSYTQGVTPVAYALGLTGQPVILTATQQLEPTGETGSMAVRISPHGFHDPVLSGKHWSHVAVAVQKVTSATSVQVRFSSATSMVGGSVLETLAVPLVNSLVQLPDGSLLRHPVPLAHRRGWLLRAEVIVNLSTGLCVVELVGGEARESITNKQPVLATSGGS